MWKTRIIQKIKHDIEIYCHLKRLKKLKKSFRKNWVWCDLNAPGGLEYYKKNQQAERDCVKQILALRYGADWQKKYNISDDEICP